MSDREITQKEIESWLVSKFPGFQIAASIQNYCKGKARVISFINPGRLNCKIMILKPNKILVGGQGQDIMKYAGVYSSVEEVKNKFLQDSNGF